MRLCVKLQVLIATMMIVSLGVLSLVLWIYTSQAIQDQLVDKITALRHIRQKQIIEYQNGQSDKINLIYNRISFRQYLYDQSFGNGMW